mmetsp:Transcript_7991/g.29896  ORF Transcript_7991/g.29896 Transcript_7991/m.29896 type:complete len:248 (+) Transcript_7991:1741-2484(+)
MQENVLFKTRFCVEVNMRFITTATLSRLVNPSNRSPRSIVMSCIRTSKALSTSVSMASPNTTDVGPLPRKSPTRITVYVHSFFVQSFRDTVSAETPAGYEPSSFIGTSPAPTRNKFSAVNHLSRGAPPSVGVLPITPVPILVFRFSVLYGSKVRRSTPMCDRNTTRLSLGTFPAFIRASNSTVSASASGAYSLAMMTPVASARTSAYAVVDWSTASTQSKSDKHSIVTLSANNNSLAIALNGFFTPT